MRRLLEVICAMGLAACVAAPGPGPAAAVPAPLEGTRWVGVVDGSPDPRTLPRIEFSSGGRMAGFTGCNMMSGSWTEEGGAVRFGPIISTKRFCAGPEGEVEKRLMAAMSPSARAARSGDRLVLTSPGGAKFEFVPASAT
jgi:heat shock protein HslJ